mmetsp:Transcript_15732/g.32224  ORF Transcript_15732/g.32224 Transcript_15732/m.32224 type:complete len:512 (-) Transcript_15732:475-2010(-)
MLSLSSRTMTTTILSLAILCSSLTKYSTAIATTIGTATTTTTTADPRCVSSRLLLSATIAGGDVLRLEEDSIAQHETERKDGDETTIPVSSLLSHSFEELAEHLGGTGRAKACWDCLRMGIDPVWYYGKQHNQEDEECMEQTGSPLLRGWSRKQVEERLAATSTRGSPTKLGEKTLGLLEQVGGEKVEKDVCKLTQISVSPDGTTKLLLQLVSDGLEVETVIIPWEDRGKSTLCVSSQVGCRQGCTFCSTGRMGKLRSLSTVEILAQMYWANKIYRLSLSEEESTNNNSSSSKKLYPIDNCVFMGMGEPADNAPAVVKAATMMADINLFRLAPRKITISTVAPNPGVFQELAEAPAVLAWSVHSSRDEIRRQLVPTTKHSMEELRDGLMETLRGRTKRLRNTMLEITLLDEINDSPEDAKHLADFCRSFYEGPAAIKGIKLTVNLIPWNDISASFGPASGYRQPKMERVRAYQKILGENGVLCYVRTTRGDEENAACGMLSTKKRQRKGDK